MAVRQIAGGDRLEKKIRHTRVGKIRQWRQRYARPVLEKLWQWLEQQKDMCPESSALGKAIAYTLKRRIILSRFLGDGALPLDNNRCERAIRPVVTGRSNWLFAGSAAAGERTARIMSLPETAKMNSLEPHAWLTDVLQGRKIIWMRCCLCRGSPSETETPDKKPPMSVLRTCAPDNVNSGNPRPT